MSRSTAGGLLAVRTEGGLISPDILAALSNPGSDIDGLQTEDYHLDGGRLSEAITKSWNRMLGEWTRFQEEHAKLSPDDPATGITRERFLLPLFSELGYGRLVPARGLEAGGKVYSISHLWNLTPIHLVGCGVDLDRRKGGVAGAAQASPHGLVQDFLNRSEDHLWGFVSNGLLLRILRDNRSLTRQAYVEMDLETIFTGQLYPDFVALWLMCHQSRVEAARPEECWLERWLSLGQERGARALDSLRDGVQQAIDSFGRGFLAHRSNAKLRDKLKGGGLSKQDFYRQLLRLVYRLLFLFVAEDRDALHPPDTPPESIALYRDYYSTHRLRMMAEKIRGSVHADLYAGFRMVMRLLGTLGAPELGLPVLGSFLWSEESVSDLIACDISNSYLLEAVRALGFTRRGKDLWRVDYRNLGSEELGSVYESLLELVPDLNVDAHSFSLTVVAGHERKTTGSYYTPHSLVQCLLDSALDPVLDEAARSPNPEQAILRLKVCDPATGSGHFLIAAAHRMARRLASVRTGDDEPAPEATHHALRDIIGKCIYGVDVNPMAVELCKVSLWMEALEPGKPLSFLDSHILCGNSLLGTTPQLMAKGIPDEAIGELTGDDKATAKAHRKRNREERQGQLGLRDETSALWGQVLPAVEMLRAEGVDDSTLAGVQALEELYYRHVESESFRHARLAADAWCASFVWPRDKGQKLPGLTHGVWNEMIERPYAVPAQVLAEVERIAAMYRFFHWHLAFPEIFVSESGGFDIMLGNPPWDQVQLDAREFFAESAPDIAQAAHMAARDQAIEKLADSNPFLHGRYLHTKRRTEGEQYLEHHSGRFPLTSFGRLNLAPLFTELGLSFVARRGRSGMIVPSGIATDSFNQYFFQSIVDSGALVSLYSFENEERLFPAIHHAYKFCLLTLSAGRSASPMQFAFYLRQASQVADPKRRFHLTREDIALMNPNTRTCPIFRNRHDAEIMRAISRRVPVLVNDSLGPEGDPWAFQGLLMFMMNTGSSSFRTRHDLEGSGFELEGNLFRHGNQEYLPLYEGKMIHQFDHRFGTYDGQTQAQENAGVVPYLSGDQHANPTVLPLPRYWVARVEVADRLDGKWGRGWLLGWRDITNTTNERTVIASAVPRVGAGDTLLVALPNKVSSAQCGCLLANLNSMALDYAARQKVGGTHLKFHVFKQLPVLPPSAFDTLCPWAPNARLKEWILVRVLELVYTALDLEPFARDCGYYGPPFKWNEDRRFQLRCELDAVFFHLYLPEDTDGHWRQVNREDELNRLAESFRTPRDAVAYIMDTFPIVKRTDEQEHDGSYWTRNAVLQVYDQMSRVAAENVTAKAAGRVPVGIYISPLAPRPAHRVTPRASLLQCPRGTLINGLPISIGHLAQPLPPQPKCPSRHSLLYFLQTPPTTLSVRRHLRQLSCPTRFPAWIISIFSFWRRTQVGAGNSFSQMLRSAFPRRWQRRLLS